LELPGTRDRGRPRKTWSACVKNDDYMQPGWCQPVRQEFMENECEALPGVAYPGVRDNRSTLNTKTGYDDDDEFNIKDCARQFTRSIPSKVKTLYCFIECKQHAFR